MISPVSLISRHLRCEQLEQQLLKLPLQLETSPSQVQVEAPHWQWAWCQCLTRTAQVGHLVMASFSQVHNQSVRSTGRVRSQGRESLSNWQQSQLYHGSCHAIMARAPHCMSANNCDTPPYGAIAKVFKIIQY